MRLSDLLTPCERKVLKYAKTAMTNVEIAKKLNRSPATIKAHLRIIYLKTGVHNRVGLVLAAKEEMDI